MKNDVLVRAPAKLNLHLSVGPRRADGFHELVTVYLAVSLYDEVTVRPADGLSMSVAGDRLPGLPLGADNLAWRAAELLAARAGAPADAHLELAKQIPIAAGLAGGSADAAAALVGCDRLWGTRLSRADLLELAEELGSDVAFSLAGGLALGTGRGELLTSVLATGDWHWVLAVADGGLATPAVYAELDRQRAGQRPSLKPPDQLINALRARDARWVGRLACNDLQEPAVALRPGLRATLREGADLGALAGLVSGSGPTCAFLLGSSRGAVRFAAALSGAEVCRTVRIVHGPVAGARIVA